MAQAFYLVERGYSAVVHEKENHLGGLLGTHHPDALLVEQAANAFMNNAEVERVSKQIGVELVPVRAQAKKRFLYRAHKMRRWPLSIAESLPLVQFMFKATIAKSSIDALPGETLRAWSLRHWGQAGTDFVLEPAMQGIYAISLDDLDAASILHSIFSQFPKAQQRGSVAPRGGMTEWMDRMRDYLQARSCEFIVDENDPSFLQSQPTIVAVGLKDLKKLAQEKTLELPIEIEQTQCCSLTSVSLYYQQKTPFAEGFGCLFPNPENFNSKGVLFNHNIFPDRCGQGSLETWILNDQNQSFSTMSGPDVLRSVLSDRQRLTGMTVAPDRHFIFQWPQRIPIYNQALSEFNKALAAKSSKCLFVGNYLGHLGLGKILFRAQENAAKVAGGFFG